MFHIALLFYYTVYRCLFYFIFPLLVSFYAVVEMAMNSILNPDDIKKALDAFKGKCDPPCHPHLYSYSKIWFEKQIDEINK